ncbi:hypothetical protein ACWGDE_12610 [Streptomyces sp. NPDC054956]
MAETSRPRIVDTILRNLLAYAVCVAALLTMAGCNPMTYDPVPAVFDARAAEIVGTWRCVEGTEVVFRADGTASVTLLDGQERDYDGGWRVSGSATWKLTGAQPAGWKFGQHVRLDLPARSGSAVRADVRHETDPPPAPQSYRWTFELRRDERQRLELYFFYGDPGSRSPYVLERDRSL